MTSRLRNTVIFLVAAGIVLVGIFLWLNSPITPQDDGQYKGTIRALTWAGYDEPEIVRPFEKETGLRVLTENFTSGDNMFAKVTKSPDAWDVVVIDPEYIQKLHAANLLSELNPGNFNFSNYAEPLQHFELCWINGRLYAVLVRFGVNGIVYNREKLKPEEVSSYQVLWSPKVQGKIGIWDWYLPNMGVLSLAEGFGTPYVLTDAQFSRLRGRLVSLAPRVNAVMGNFSDINAAFARGDIWLAPALGEHTAAILSEQGYPIDWTIPKEGAIMWVETLGILSRSTNKEAALKYIQYFQRPEVQAKLTWRRAYRSNIPNTQAIQLLTKAQQDALKVHSPQEANQLVKSLHVRNLPVDSVGRPQEAKWQSAWQEFKSTIGKE